MSRVNHHWQTVEEPIEKCIHCGCYRRRKALTDKMISHGVGKWHYDYSMPHSSKWGITRPDCI